jgi:hypothetical protein
MIQVPFGFSRFVLVLAMLCAAASALALDDPTAALENASSVMPLYRSLRTVRLDPEKAFKVREGVLDRDDLHIFLTDGVVVFTKEVNGHITGMYFEGDGELLVRPPNRTERESLGLFTKLGVLEDKFTYAYFRFNDDVLVELKPFLRPLGDFDLSPMLQLNSAAEQLADVDALRLLASFTSGPASDEKGRKLIPDHFLHARVSSNAFGTYDVIFDTRNPEQIAVAQMARADGASYYDLWMSFAERRVRDNKVDGVVPLRAADSLHADQFKIDSVIQPPNNISAEADLDLTVSQGGARVLFFELSHELKLKKVTKDDAPVEWLQNEAIEGTQLARRGNDFIAVVLPEPCKAGDQFHLHFSYQGSVLADAGNGLLYVGAHGIWYPNRGLTPSRYELTFTYPQAWTLVAVGKKTAETTNGEMRTSHWVSDLPVPVAGFNLGRYVEAREKAGDADVAAYASHGVEKTFPVVQTYVVQDRSQDPLHRPSSSQVTLPLAIDPSATTKTIADDAAKTVEFYDRLLGPYPFSSLKLTQFPGPDSQGWPGLIYLSSYAFLTSAQRQQLGMNEFVKAFFGTLVLRHEVAHMWWGHEVFWDSYRDQWLSEALANYSALLMTEQEEPGKFRILMEGYRGELFSKRDGRDLFEAGPVTLGLRLNSAKFPDAYQAIAYGRGTWLIHMLRCMLEDGTRSSRTKSEVGGDELFLQVLRTVLKRHRNTGMSTDDLRRAFEEVLPVSLRFEGRKSLDWFFDGWVNGTVIPALEVSGVKFSKQGTEEFVSGIIRQKYAPNDLVTSVPVYAQAGERFEYLGRVFAVGEETRFRLQVRGVGRKIALDPFHTVLTRP